MLVRDADAGGTAWLAIGQASHAWVSGQVARAWGSARLPAPEPREAVVLAAEQHDVGMAEWDRRPALHPETGRARAFTQLPRPLHLELWEAAPAKLETQSRLAAALVCGHGISLYTELGVDEADRPLVEPYLERQRARRDALLAAAGLRADAAFERLRRLVFCWDALSLGLCLEWPAGNLPPVDEAGGGAVRLRRTPVPGGATLEPWPFAAPEVVVEAEGRRVPGPCADAEALHTALDAAPSLALRWTLRPAG